MNILELTDQSLKDLHSLIGEAMVADDAASTGPKPYGVRETSDWKRQADAFEAEMKKRGVSFKELDWKSPTSN